MNTTLTTRPVSSVDINTRVETVDWASASTHLDGYGWATLERLLTADECEAIAGLYEEDRRFRSRVVMASHGFGRGEYKYFAHPLPDIVADLRRAIYPNLAPIANRWNESMGIEIGMRIRRSCCNTPRVTTTLSTRISMASMSFRCS